jgi:hypothetical protein
MASVRPVRLLAAGAGIKEIGGGDTIPYDVLPSGSGSWDVGAGNTLTFTRAVTLSSTLGVTGAVTLGGATNPVLISRLTASTTYGAISFNSDVASSASILGVFGRVNPNESLYFNVPAGYKFVFTTNGVEDARLIGGTLLLKTTLAGSATAGGARLTGVSQFDDTVYLADNKYLRTSSHVLIGYETSGNFVRIGSGSAAASVKIHAGGAERLRIDTAGDVTIASLAGTGTRTVVVDANGVLSAP